MSEGPAIIELSRAMDAQSLERARRVARFDAARDYEQFGCAGQGSKLQPVPLEKMATRYAKGELAAVVN